MGKTLASHYPHHVPALPSLRPPKSIKLAALLDKEFRYEASHWRMDAPRLAEPVGHLSYPARAAVIAYADGREILNYFDAVQVVRVHALGHLS